MKMIDTCLHKMLQKVMIKVLVMVAHSSNTTDQDTKAEGLQVQGQPRLCGKALSQKKSNNNRKPYD
jgi:hypothetical protein